MKFSFIIMSALLLCGNVWATKDIHDSILRVKAGDKELRFSGYFDGYYAHDFSNPVHGEEDFEVSNHSGGRQYTSNPLYAFSKWTLNTRTLAFVWRTTLGTLWKKCMQMSLKD
jgi:hypothetical protein